MIANMETLDATTANVLNLLADENPECWSEAQWLLDQAGIKRRAGETRRDVMSRVAGILFDAGYVVQELHTDKGDFYRLLHSAPPPDAGMAVPVLP